MKELKIGRWYKYESTHWDKRKICIYKILSTNKEEKFYKVIHYCGHTIKDINSPREERIGYTAGHIVNFIEITEQEAFLEIL